MGILINLLTALTRAFFEFLHLGLTMAEPGPKDHSLRAAFATDQKTLSVYHEGFCLDGRRSLSLDESLRHAVVIGKSGIGKSTSTFIPSLLTMHTSGSSLVVHDTSRELEPLSGGHLAGHGYAILAMDLDDPGRSIGFNPMENILHPSDVDKLASQLVQTSLKGSDPFWDASARDLIKTVISLALRLGEEHRNLANVLHIIKLMGASPKAVDELVAMHADEQTFTSFKSFLSNDAKVASGILATAKAALSIFGDERVALVTSRSTLDLRDLRRRRIALFIQNKVSSQQYYSVITSIFFEQLFSTLMDAVPERSARSIYILLDEAASGLRMPSFSQAIAHLRKYRVGCMVGLQSVQQLRQTYNDNDAATILGNCHAHVYFGEQSHETAKTLESLLGRYEYVNGAGGRSVRNLMEADEVRMMGNRKAIIVAGSEKPILANLTPYYDRPWLKLRSSRRTKPPSGFGKEARVKLIGQA
ncbi:MAG: type IV secretory system conjugative DNA transfer family protein [Bacteroidetes bacterium]|nr:type IV secretory system conjugative DNA transfer family protein [Bacteroidota bacterium]